MNQTPASARVRALIDKLALEAHPEGGSFREIHRAHVMEKMGAKSVAQLVRMVMDLEQKEAPKA